MKSYHVVKQVTYTYTVHGPEAADHEELKDRVRKMAEDPTYGRPQLVSQIADLWVPNCSGHDSK